MHLQDAGEREVHLEICTCRPRVYAGAVDAGAVDAGAVDAGAVDG